MSGPRTNPGYVLGDRFGKVADPYGHHWGVATHKEDLSEEEIQKRAAEAFAKMGEREGSQ